MNRIGKLDSELVERLPLPLAQLYCRAHHAKMPLERHQSAYFLWEASVKLLASIALAESGDLDDGNLFTSRPNPNGSVFEGREWWHLLQTLSPRLAKSCPGFRSLEEFLNRPITADLPRAAELDVLLQETQAERQNPQDGTTIRDLMERIARYGQNQTAREALNPKENDYYEWVVGTLLSGIVELLGRIDLLFTRPILFVADARKQASGAWLIEQYDLRGETPHRLESLLLPPELSSSKVPLPERVYLGYPTSSEVTQSFGDIQALSPWLHFEPEGSEFFFLHGLGRSAEVEHLCYTTGRMLRRLPVGNAHHPLLDRMLGISGIAETANIAADKSLPDQPGPSVATSQRNPRRLGEFELVSCLGRGGMGVVYRAWHLPLKRQVGLKCMLRSGDPKSEARFAREIRALGRVDHPNLVKIYSSGTDGDQLFYAMELVEGTDLLTVCLQLRSTTGSNPKSADWEQAVKEACRATQGREQVLDTEQFGPGTTATMQIQIGPDGARPTFEENLPKSDHATPPVSKGTKPSVSHSRSYVDRVVDVIRQVAEAVHALHEASIVHRDIKPGNIMVTKDGRQAVLMDLGLAQLADETEGRLTHTLDYVGTLRYSSPEQLRAAHHVDLRTDIYSLGATFWELLTLQPLFGAGRTTSPARLMMDIQSTAPSRPRHWNPRIPADLEIIVLKCLEKNPARRYSSAGELAADLRRWQQGLPVQAQPPTLRYILGKHIQRHWVLLSTLAAVLFIAALAGSWFVYQLNEARDAAVTALDRETEAHQTASRYFQEARAISDRTVEHLSELLKHFPDASTRGADLIEETLADYVRLAKEKPDDRLLNLELAKARFHAAKAYENIGLLEKSEQHFHAVETQLESLSLGEADADWHWLKDQSRIHRGRILTELGKPKDAEESFTRAGNSLEKSLAGNSIHLTEAANVQLAIEWARHAMIQEQFGEAKSRLNTAVDLAEKLLADEEDASVREALASALTTHGQLLIREGEYQEAVDTVQKALQHLSRLEEGDDHSTSLRETKAYALVVLGNALRPSGEDEKRIEAYQSALAYYEALLEVYPNAPRLLRTWAISATNLAYVLHKVGRNAEAREATEQALRVLDVLHRGRAGEATNELDLVTGFTLLGQISQQLGDLDVAEQCYAEAFRWLSQRSEGEQPDVSLFERRGLAFVNRGRLLQAQNQRDEAEADFTKGIEQLKAASARQSRSVQLKEHLAWAEELLGDLYFETHRREEAAGQYSAALKVLAPLDSPDQLYNRARLLAACCDVRVCEPETACELAAKAVEKCPRNPRYAGILGLAYLRNGQPDLAQKRLEAAASGNSKDIHPLPLLCLALAHQQLGQTAKAQTVFNQARELPLMAQNPGDPLLKRLEQEIEQGFASGGP